MYTQIIAHRGASKYAPENTMDAFNLAYKMGAESIETDIHLTKDKIPVLIHDETVNRTTNAVGLVSQFTFHELNQLDAGSWFDPSFSTNTILSLEEFLQWIINKPLYLNIELKNNKIEYKHLESIVFEMLQHFQLLNRTTISTFNPKSVERMKKFKFQLELAYLTSRKHRNIVQLSKDLGANALHINYRLLHPELVKQCKQEDMALRVFTVNKPHRMIHCFQQQVDGLITDVPDQAIQIRKLVTK